MENAIWAVCFLAMGLFFSGATINGIKTGKMRAIDFGTPADREKEPDWFWGWVIMNGCAGLSGLIGFLFFVAVALFAKS